MAAMMVIAIVQIIRCRHCCYSTVNTGYNHFTFIHQLVSTLDIL